MSLSHSLSRKTIGQFSKRRHLRSKESRMYSKSSCSSLKSKSRRRKLLNKCKNNKKLPSRNLTSKFAKKLPISNQMGQLPKSSHTISQSGAVRRRRGASTTSHASPTGRRSSTRATDATLTLFGSRKFCRSNAPVAQFPRCHPRACSLHSRRRTAPSFQNVRPASISF